MAQDVDAYGRARTQWTVVIDLAIDHEPAWEDLRRDLLAYVTDEEPPGEAIRDRRRGRTARFTLTRPRDPEEAPAAVVDAWIADLQDVHAQVRADWCRLAPPGR